MTVKDQDNKEVEIESVFGKYEDDIQWEGFYVDSIEAMLSDETIDYITKEYSQELYEEWMDNKIGQADFYMDELMGK